MIYWTLNFVLNITQITCLFCPPYGNESKQSANVLPCLPVLLCVNDEKMLIMSLWNRGCSSMLTSLYQIFGMERESKCLLWLASCILKLKYKGIYRQVGGIFPRKVMPKLQISVYVFPFQWSQLGPNNLLLKYQMFGYGFGWALQTQVSLAGLLLVRFAFSCRCIIDDPSDNIS